MSRHNAKKKGTFLGCLGNVLWFFLCGLESGLGWFLAGLLLCLTIIGIPFGKQCFKLASLSFFPFEKTVEGNFGRHPVANVIWALLCGWGFFIGYLISGVLLCITVIGIPCGLQCFKLAKLSFFPFGAAIY